MSFLKKIQNLDNSKKQTIMIVATIIIMIIVIWLWIMYFNTIVASGASQ